MTTKKKPTIEYKLPHQRKRPEVEPWTTIKGKQPKEVKHLPIQLWKRPEVGPWTIHPRKRPEVEPPIRKRVKPLSELPPEGFTKFERARRKPITSEEAYEELMHGKKSLLPLRKKKEPTTEWKPPKKKPTTEWKPPKKKLTTEFKPPKKKLTTEFKPPKKKLTTEYKLPHLRKPPKEVEPWTIHPRRQPKKVEPRIGIPPHTKGVKFEPRIGIPPQVNPIKFKSAPARSPTLKRNIKKR